MSLVKIRRWFLGLWGLGLSYAAAAQGSATMDLGYRTSASTDSTFEYADTLYVGSGAVWEIDGVHTLYCRYIWLAPSAQISGNGKLILADPSTNPMYSVAPSPTYIDGNNGVEINVNVELHNPNNLILENIPDVYFGTLDAGNASDAALIIGKDFSLAVDNGDVILNGYNFIFTDNATISNYSALRMVVTGNSIEGHMVKLNSAETSFVFPVGIDEGDYTPATITGSNDYFVSVQDYSASLASESEVDYGMDRTWHIFGGDAVYLALQHNSPATDGAQYSDAEAFITQYLGGSNWPTGSPEQIGAVLHANTGSVATLIPSTGDVDGAYFTKTSFVGPLGVDLLSFEAQKENEHVLLTWATTSETNNKGFAVQRSVDGAHWTQLGFVASKAPQGSSTTGYQYQFVDLQPQEGVNYYRLKQIDINGKYTFSEIRLIQFAPNATIAIYPNPTHGHIHIDGLKGAEQIYIFDNSGRLMLQQQAASSKLQLSLADLSAGLYLISIEVDDNRTVYRVVKN